ncbi:hypothetical protein [Kitasatospora sp. NPDC001547]|uniref:hypothetical protein n=1 Tax=Kitasatospora sp. NPDC001547 TaxID=3364015 RepID=UPI003695E0FF
MESPTRAIEDEDQTDDGARCGWCRKPIRATGPGQRPGYCPGRSCSSKAYRARRQARQDAVLAAAADGTREPSTMFNAEAAEQLARLGALAERTARRLAGDLDAGAAPMHLRVSLSALTQAAQSLLAHARTAVQQAEAGLPGQPAAPGLDGTRAASSGKTAPNLDGTRVAPSDGVGLPEPADPPTSLLPPAPRPATYGPATPEATRVPSRDGGLAVREAQPPTPTAPTTEQRAEIANTVPDTIDRIARHTPPPAQPTPPPPPQLALDTRISALSPEFLGDPDQHTDLGDGLTLHGWAAYPRVATIEQRGRTIAWIEEGVRGPAGWAVLVEGRLVVDRVDHRPLLAETNQDAIALLRLALRQGVVR